MSLHLWMFVDHFAGIITLMGLVGLRHFGRYRIWRLRGRGAVTAVSRGRSCLLSLCMSFFLGVLFETAKLFVMANKHSMAPSKLHGNGNTLTHRDRYTHTLPCFFWFSFFFFFSHRL